VLKIWPDYLFLTLESAPDEIQFLVAKKDIARMMASSGHEDVVLDKDDKIYEKGDKFKIFHHQASQSMSQKALLAGFLSV